MKSSRRMFLITSIGVASTFALSRQAFADAAKVA
ncbi:MAG TPA: High potential iron-sulfur protein, partial [Paraburkholderia sp.]